MAKNRTPSKPQNYPEKKIGPFAGGVGVAIWVNEVQTEDGTRPIRSISINPRRYLDKQTGEWKDATSFRPADLPALLFALAKAQEYCFTQPLSGQNGEAPAGEEVPY
jgi:hypothetical protein